MGRNVYSSYNSHNAKEVESVTVENNYLAERTLTINNNNNDERNILNEENALTDLNNSESINKTTCKASSVGFDIHRISISHRNCCICKKESYDKKWHAFKGELCINKKRRELCKIKCSTIIL